MFYDIFLKYPVIGIITVISAAAMSYVAASKAYIIINRHMLEGFGRRKRSRFILSLKNYVEKIVYDYENRDKKTGLYLHARDVVRQAGYHSLLAPAAYLFGQYILPAVMFVILFIVVFPQAGTPLLLSIYISLAVRLIMLKKKKDIEREFKHNAYKIFRFINNQLDAGVNISDVIKNIHLTAVSTKLEKPLLSLSAHYARYYDIDGALRIFRQYFTMPEIDALCAALVQGVNTGNSSGLLAKQEGVMFDMYFNFIQSETESAKRKALIVVGLLSLIVCVMIFIPMLIDTNNAIKVIFSVG